MTNEAADLEATLLREHPAAARSLSALGRTLAFPKGIPFQAAQARGSTINATLGQLTDDRGHPLPLPAIARGMVGLDPRQTFLYAPIEGPPALREAWLARQRRLAGEPTVPVSAPFVTHGLTHGLSLLADLFVDADTDVVLPSPCWENYDLLFTMRNGARIVPYSPWTEGAFDAGRLAAALATVRGKALVVLNFPSNPTGWWPDPGHARALVDVILAHPGPLVVVTDDAYQGFVYEEGLHDRSLFWDLAERADPERHLIVKCDGATKELVFFSSRVGFLTHSATGEAERVITEKLKTLVRGTVGSASGPALSLVAAALADPRSDDAFEDRRRLMAGRYRALRRALKNLDPSRLRAWPFNAAYFAFLELGPGLDAEVVRRRLLDEHATGTIAFPDQRALRVAYCSLDEERIPALVEALDKAARP